MEDQNTPQPVTPPPQTEPVNTAPPQQVVQPSIQQPQVVQPQPQQSFTQDFTQPQAFSGTVSPQKKKKTVPIIIAIVVALVLLVGGGVFAYTQLGNKDEPTSKSKSQSSAATDSTKSATTDTQISDIITGAGGRALGATLGSFYAGGTSSNESEEKQYADNGYYPSESDMKDATWIKNNLLISKLMQDSLSNGTYTYKSIGCDSDKTASKQNACSGFTITIKQTSGKNLEVKNTL
ncbi:hypothetical protein KBD20_00970 [Candidatus Saccharibacteria bacterium]|nr:hypothetical protein [Candidatus Saccharibacteria bacterium]